ncbi:hypothetical protein DYB25_006367 [Aphanomyces astaci]|uniref:Uncharacterized protein n=1 Tax=Aphanomyces astaci TaxID=112090 RepID=A0A397BUT4_APHAT|nr:hypothetical protein DYB25_006367 [Aphanomyces astaci]RHY38065.1 hypothetical protein DYB38_002978 [Aphanomyces astaci]RHY45899.1 hypothetical protein DYB30_001733 [Aphanomyces astaci]RHY65846.1 hypothetical protein DYB34_003988 [Aphanomyces astaci]RHY81328.1 hypothetical protein DYB31_007848 [Aphanomyces astaci]
MAATGDSKLQIVAGTYEGMLYGWEASTKDLTGKKPKSALKMVYGYPAHTECIKALAMMMEHDGKTLLTGGNDEMIKIYNVKKKVEVGILMQHKGTTTPLRLLSWGPSYQQVGPVNSIAVHPSGKLAFSVSKDKTLRMWNLVKGRSAYIRRLDQEATCVFLSQDGNRLLAKISHPDITARIRSLQVVAKVDANELPYVVLVSTNGVVQVYDLAQFSLSDSAFEANNAVEPVASARVFGTALVTCLSACRLNVDAVDDKPTGAKKPKQAKAAAVEPKKTATAVLAAPTIVVEHEVTTPASKTKRKAQDSTDDDEFEVPALNKAAPVAANWDDEEEEEEAPKPVVAKSNAAAPTGPLKPKQLKKQILKEQEEKHRLEVAIARARAEDERNMTADELKAKQLRAIEHSDFENTLDAFGLSANPNIERKKVSGPNEIETLVTGMKLASLADHEELGSLVGKRLANSNAKHVVEFMKTLISHASNNLTADDMKDITTIINVIKNDKIAAAKPKSKKKKITGKQGYAKVERGGAAGVENFEDDGDDFDDFM